MPFFFLSFSHSLVCSSQRFPVFASPTLPFSPLVCLTCRSHVQAALCSRLLHRFASQHSRVGRQGVSAVVLQEGPCCLLPFVHMSASHVGASDP